MRFPLCRSNFAGELAEKAISVGLPRIEKRFVSQDGTVRYLIGFADGQSVETVWMPEGDGGKPEMAARPEIRRNKRKVPVLTVDISRDRIRAARRSAFRARWDAPWIASFV